MKYTKEAAVYKSTTVGDVSLYYNDKFLYFSQAS